MFNSVRLFSFYIKCLLFFCTRVKEHSHSVRGLFFCCVCDVNLSCSVPCSCWSSSLDNVMKRHTEKSTKHWFSIYQLVERYLEEQSKDANTGTHVACCLPATLLKILRRRRRSELNPYSRDH